MAGNSMQRMTDNEIAELRDLDTKATPGPWAHPGNLKVWAAVDLSDPELDGVIVDMIRDDACIIEVDGWRDLANSKDPSGEPRANANLVVKMRNALPRLLDELVERRAGGSSFAPSVEAKKSKHLAGEEALIVQYARLAYEILLPNWSTPFDPASISGSRLVDAMVRVIGEDRAREDEERDHVDHFIDTHSPDDTPGQRYAKWMLHHFRMPAVWQMHFAPFLEGRRLFCTWEGKRWRVTGASRMGAVWLASDLACEVGYDERVGVAECTEWGPGP